MSCMRPVGGIPCTIEGPSPSHGDRCWTAARSALARFGVGPIGHALVHHSTLPGHTCVMARTAVLKLYWITQHTTSRAHVGPPRLHAYPAYRGTTAACKSTQAESATLAEHTARAQLGPCRETWAHKGTHRLMACSPGPQIPSGRLTRLLVAHNPALPWPDCPIAPSHTHTHRLPLVLFHSLPVAVLPGPVTLCLSTSSPPFARPVVNFYLSLSPPLSRYGHSPGKHAEA